jgi:hypothetical protein
MITLKKKEKILVVIFAALVTAFGVDKGIMAPFKGKVSDIEREIAATEGKLVKMTNIDRNSGAITAFFTDIQPYAVFTDSGDDAVSMVMKKIEELAKESGISILNMKPEAAQKEAKGQKEAAIYSESKVALNVEGQQRDLVTFLYNLENMKYAMTIRRIDLKIKDRANNTMEADIAANFIYFVKQR